MHKNTSATPWRAAVFATVALAFSLVSSSSSHASMTDQATGERCVGIDCADKAPPVADKNPVPVTPSYVLPSNVTTEGCSSTDSKRIGQAVEWLQDNLTSIGAKMLESSPYLMYWPGNSRENFREKLDKDLKFVCINEKDKCNRLWGITYPIVAQQRINLCTTNLNQAGGGDAVKTDSLYVHVVAHEIGHLVRLNAHSSSCVKRYTEGTFSDALGFAAEYAFLGIPYDPWKLVEQACGHEPFDWTRKQENMEPPLQAEK